MKIEEFWNDSHTRKVISDLSGSKYDETLDSLKIRSFIAPGKHVLEVGAGLGYVIKGFYDAGLVVSALDISNVALEKVREYCEYLFTVDDLDKMPSNYFDIVACVNVVQHIPTNTLIEELRHCIRSLKAAGVFAIEFVSTDSVEDTWTKDYIYPGKGLPGFCRTPKYLEKLIGEVGGTCELVYDVRINAGVVTGCHVFHIRRK